MNKRVLITIIGIIIIGIAYFGIEMFDLAKGIKEDSYKAETIEQTSWRDHWEKPTQKAELLSNSKVHKRIKECLLDTSIVVLTSTLIDDLERYSKIKALGH